MKAEEGQFNRGVESIGNMVKVIHAEQMAVVGNALKEITSKGDALKRLQQNNAPASEYLGVADALNIKEFSCALEGMPGMPSGGCQGVQSTSVSQRGQIMQSVANGTRTNFTSNPPNIGSALASINQDYYNMSKFLMDLQGNEGSHGFVFDIGAGLGDRFTRDPATNRRLTTVGGDSRGFLGVQWRHAAGGWMLRTQAYSDDRSGRHTPGSVHEGRHGSFPGCDQGDCFVNFRASDNAKDDFNQPSTYGAVKQDLRWTINGQRPWELSEQATVNVALGNVGDIKVRLAPDREGFAVSKGKAYFHQLDDWRVAPNAFDPFWRAKLHRFDDAMELNTVTAGAGDPTRITGAPVEGRP